MQVCRSQEEVLSTGEQWKGAMIEKGWRDAGMNRTAIVPWATWTGGVAVLLFAGAMLAYPGGTSLNPGAAGYSFAHNFLSDLMTIRAWNGEPNTVSAVLAGTGMALLAGAFIGFSAAVTRLLSTTGRQRRILRGALAATILAGVGLVGAALTSPDWWMTAHLRLATLAVGSGVGACLLFGVGSWREPTLSRGMAQGWLGLALVLTGLFSMRWGPSITDERGLTVQVISQKMATVAILAMFFYQNSMIERRRAR